jgi:hypothetical protein
MFKEEGRVHQKPRREPKQASNDWLNERQEL